MNPDIYTYLIDMQTGQVKEYVSPNPDGSYTVYINSRLNQEQRLRSYQHALRHIQENDFEKSDAGLIELWAHR